MMQVLMSILNAAIALQQPIIKSTVHTRLINLKGSAVCNRLQKIAYWNILHVLTKLIKMLASTSMLGVPIVRNYVVIQPEQS